MKKFFKNVEKAVKQVVRAPERILIKPICKLFKLPNHIVTSVQFVYNRVKDILFSQRAWVETEIEPPVTDYIDSIQPQINASNNPEVFSKTATLAKEKELINGAYMQMRSNLTQDDIQRLDALAV